MVTYQANFLPYTHVRCRWETCGQKYFANKSLSEIALCKCSS